MYPSAVEYDEEGGVEIDLAIAVANAKQLVANDLVVAVDAGGKAVSCNATHPMSIVDIQHIPEGTNEVSATAIFHCDVSLTGRANLLVEVKGTKATLPMNMKSS